MPIIATYDLGPSTQITVEQSSRGYDVVISGAGRLPSRVGTYSAKFRALNAAADLAGVPALPTCAELAERLP